MLLVNSCLVRCKYWRYSANIRLLTSVLFFCFFFKQIYPGFYHKLLNEPKEDAALVMSDIIAWINQRLPSTDTK